MTRQSDRHGAVHAILLAAGGSRRMGAGNKLLAELSGKPLIRHAAEHLLAAGLPVTVVTGHEAKAVEAALEGLPVSFAHAERWAEGLSRSLAAGLNALPGGCAGALIALGDMPFTTPAGLQRLLAAFDPGRERLIVVPSAHGRRGNPVIFSRALFGALAGLSGDIGGRGIIAANPDATVEIEVPPSELADIDTQEALEAARAASAKAHPGG